MRKTVRAIAVLYVLGCLAIDLFPSYGPPQFRYPGSDPQTLVWNLGWPLAEFIYDPRSGLHTGPTALPIMTLQVVLLLLGIVAWRIAATRARQRFTMGDNIGCGVRLCDTQP